MKKYNFLFYSVGIITICMAMSSNVNGEYGKACIDNFVKIQGPTIAVYKQPQKREWIYTSEKLGQKVDVAVKIEEEKDKKKQNSQASIIQKQEKQNGGYFLASFGSPGVFNLFITFSYVSGQNQTIPTILCAKKIPITVYTKSILYWQENKEKESIDKKLLENILSRHVLFSIKNLQEEKKEQNDEEILFHMSEFLFFNGQNFKNIFANLEKREKKGILKDKKIFLITQKDKELEKKSLMPFVISNNKKNIYLINTKEFKDYLVDLALGKTEIEKQLLETTPLTLQPGGKGIAKIINILVYHGITKETLGFLLMLFVVICLLIFCKHVIGLPCYGLYYPIIGAIGILLLETKTSIILIGSSILGYIITRFVAKKMMLLVYGKVSLYILLSLILFMTIQTILFTHFSYNTTTSPYQETNGLPRAIGILCLILSIRKVFGESYNPRRIKRWIHILWFSILAYGISQILTNTKYQETLLIYPRIIFIVFVITIILGTYSQLQLIELFRFWSLIRKKMYKK